MSGVWWKMSDVRWIKMSGVRTATPNNVYTHQGAKPACQKDINAKNFRILYWHSYPERRLRQTRMIFAPPIGTAAPNTVYKKQAAKPACSNLPNPHGSDGSTQNFRSSYWRSYPDNVFTQQPAKPAWQLRINAQFSQLLFWRSSLRLPHKATGAQRQHRAPQTLVAALDTAPATQSCRAPAATARAADPSSGSGYCTSHTEPPGPSGNTAHRRPFWRLWILRLPHKAAGATTQRAANPSSGSNTAPATQSRSAPATPRSSGSGYCACHTEPPGPSGDTARRRPF